MTEQGPYLVKGAIRLVGPDGELIGVKGKVSALCRYGGSATKPFCDGTQSKISFTAAERPRPVRLGAGDQDRRTGGGGDGNLSRAEIGGLSPRSRPLRSQRPGRPGPRRTRSPARSRRRHPRSRG
ncbi:MAG: CDGSH iron-sulfur domain-containing protein [Actinomycetota bacterium]